MLTAKKGWSSGSRSPGRGTGPGVDLSVREKLPKRTLTLAWEGKETLGSGMEAFRRFDNSVWRSQRMCVGCVVERFERWRLTPLTKIEGPR